MTVAIGKERAPKIIINDTIDLFLLNCNQHFGNFKQQQFPTAIWQNCFRIFHLKIYIYILALEIASARNRHCASCIGTVLFRIWKLFVVDSHRLCRSIRDTPRLAGQWPAVCAVWEMNAGFPPALAPSRIPCKKTTATPQTNKHCIPSPPHSFIPGLKPSFSANPSHRSLPFLLRASGRSHMRVLPPGTLCPTTPAPWLILSSPENCWNHIILVKLLTLVDFCVFLGVLAFGWLL